MVEMGTIMVAGPDTTASGKWEKGDRGLGPGWRWRWTRLWLQGVTPRPVLSGRKGIDAWDLGGLVGVEMDTFMFAGRDTTASAKWEKGDRHLGPGGAGGGGDGHVYVCRA